MGLALAEAALEAGERVAGTARRAERFGRLQGAYEGRLLAVEHDVRDTGSAAAVVEAAMDRLGRVDVLVNNAGAGQVGTAEEISDEALHDMLANTSWVPLPTCGRCCLTCAPRDRARSSR